MTEVSVVIPTRNRSESLLKLLADLSEQKYPLKEVIVVDSSDEMLDEKVLGDKFPSLNILYLTSRASVCVQRNTGISMATAPYVFLCDDDISIGEDYVAVLMKHLEQSGCGAVSGLVMQKEGESWCYEYPPSSFGKLFFAFVFQHSVWGNVDHITASFWQKPLYSVIKRYYHRRGNSISIAGWPILTDFEAPFFRATIYGLGASVVKKEWLLQSPYDEVLDAHGIGDNYGVAIGFPGKKPVHVLTAAKAWHHQSTDNRLEGAATYYRRLLALDYFLHRSSRFSWWNRMWFAWSLLGNLILFRKKIKHRKGTWRALFVVLRNKNPYLSGFKSNVTVVEVKL